MDIKDSTFILAVGNSRGLYKIDTEEVREIFNVDTEEVRDIFNIKKGELWIFLE